MSLRQLQSRKESADDSKWEAKWDQNAFDSAIECEAEAIATRNLKDPLYRLNLLNSPDLLMETVVDENPRTDFAELVSMLLGGDITAQQARNTLVEWLKYRDDVQREARGNIEGDMYDNYSDPDDQWSD